MTGFIVQVILLVCVIAYFVFLTENEVNRYKKGHIIYYASNAASVIPIIRRWLNEYEIPTRECELVELGAGRATISRRLARELAWKRAVAVEWARTLVGLIRLAAWWQRIALRVVRGSIYDYEIERPAVVYCYLTSDILERLYQDGRLNGCLVVSLTFEIPGLHADRTETIPHWQSPLRLYDLRQR